MISGMLNGNVSRDCPGFASHFSESYSVGKSGPNPKMESFSIQFLKKDVDNVNKQ